MPVVSTNSASTPMLLNGASIQNGNYLLGTYFSQYYGGYAIGTIPSHRVGSITSPNQVVGLVPVFNCTDDECRNGKYGSNDHNFMLPVFAEAQLGTSRNYKNDNNSFLFNFPASSGLANYNFYLDKQISGAWVEQAELDDNTYGEYYPIGRICDKNYFTGFDILWNKVLHELGEGIYRFRVGSSTGTFTTSINHLKIIGFKAGGSISLYTTGFGVICPPFFIDDTLSFAQNMINMVAWINNYQNTTFVPPNFSASYNTGTAQIDLVGLLGQNCPFYATVYDVSTSGMTQTFTGGEDTFTVLGCFASPPFCLKTWDCWAVNSTTKFDAFYTGGVIGNIDKSLPGTTWSFCCSGKPVVYPNIKSLFTMQFWNQGVIYKPTTFTFTPDAGYDLVNPVTFIAGTTPANCAIQLAAAINAHQATLTPPQFSAVVGVARRVDITNLFGQNIGIAIDFTDDDSPITDGNTIQVTLNSLVTYLPPTPTGGGAFIWHILGQFNGGANINSASFLATVPITWRDAIRVGGEFGYENTDYEIKSIKYQTGVVNKIRDEAILKHTWKSSSLPFWFHERFKAYGLMSDKLLVSDYNMNNSDYGIKLYSVQRDSSYNPDYKNAVRETMVKCEFKPAVQNLKRQRCC